MSVHSGHSGHSGHTHSEYIDIKLEKQKLYRLKKSIDRQQQQLNEDRQEFALQIQQFKSQKNKIDIFKLNIQKLKSELSKVKKDRQEIMQSYHGALQEIQLLKQRKQNLQLKRKNYSKKLRHSKKETVNIKKRLKLALNDMDKQAQYYEQQMRKTELNTQNNNLPTKVSLINETSKKIDIEWDKFDGLLVNVKYKPKPKPQKAPSIQRSITSTIYEYDNMLTPSPSSHDNSPCSPRDAYKMYVEKMNQKQKHPKLIK